MAGAPAPLLYVHPRGHLNDLVVPAGAFSCLNAAAAPKLGRYSFEVADAEIRAAQVVAADLHWALGLPGLEALLSRVRRVNPAARIVVGGITAGHYPEAILRLGADYVIRGDAEVAFAALAEALLAGREPGPVPNVLGRGGPLAAPRRMTAEEFDETDCLRADWFPTYLAVRDWDAVAMPQGPNVPVARGCPMRCPTCYGSYASTQGPGWLLRSPGSLVRLVRQAEVQGVRNLRLLLAKPPAARLSALLAALAAAGPFRLPNAVGLFLCAPPAPADLDALESAFDAPVVLSVVPPDQHAPALAPERLEEEMDAWRTVARRVARSRRLRLDVWATGTDDLRALRRSLDADGSPSVSVSLAAVWHLTRPTDDAVPDLPDLRRAVEPFWTFYAARLLSPALSELLLPFRFLDELDAPPESSPRPEGPLGAWHDEIMERWRRHRLPALPGLSFLAVPVGLAPGTRLGRRHAGVSFAGAVGRVAGGAAPRLGEAVPLLAVPDHAGVGLRTERPVAAPEGAIALVPAPPGGGEISDAWLEALAARGLAVLRPGTPEPLDLRVTLRVQEAQLAMLDGSGAARAQGRATLGWFRPAGPARSRARGAPSP